MEFQIVNAGTCHLDALVELERRCFSIPWTRAQLTAELPGMKKRTSSRGSASSSAATT